MAKATGNEPFGYGNDLSAGTMLALVASGLARSRADLIESLGWSRATVTHRLGLLMSAGLLDEAPDTRPSGGRPTRILQINAGFAVILAADVGERSIRLAATDLTSSIIAETSVTKDVGAGPVPILSAVADGFLDILRRIGRDADDVLGIGLSLPAPVDFVAGRVVGPSVMRGWDDFDIRAWIGERFDAPVFVENDVNLMTLAEARRFWRDVRQLFYVKIGTGIGSGIVADGNLYRGAQGAAGDIGHIQVPGPSGPLCRCGKLGCVEASASGWAMARDLKAVGIPAEDARGVLAQVRASQPHAISLVRAAGRIVGEVMANIVSVLNPSVIVVGGTLSGAGDHLLAGVRELVYQRSLPLATRDLTIATARGGADVNIIGAAILVFESQMRPPLIERVIERHARPAGGRARPAPATASPPASD